MPCDSPESPSDLWTQLKQCPQDINIVRLPLIPVAHFTSLVEPVERRSLDDKQH